jgi:DNA-binding FadR family transcriptional regulator
MASGTARFNVRVPKTAELVAGHVRRQIVTGELQQGASLPSEATLMEDFQISRPTLREAFRILEAEGLIIVRSGTRGGARVQEPSVDVAARYAGLVLQHRSATLSDVLATRVIAEAPAAGMLAARRDRVRSADILRARLDEGDVDLPPHFHEFNALVVELTGNQSLMLITAMLEHISVKATARYLLVADPVEDERLGQRAHRVRRKLIDLVANGDVSGAEMHWRAHLTEAGRVLSSRVGNSVLALFD